MNELDLLEKIESWEKPWDENQWQVVSSWVGRLTPHEWFDPRVKALLPDVAFPRHLRIVKPPE